jgi:phage tail tape-measure protein
MYREMFMPQNPLEQIQQRQAQMMPMVGIKKYGGNIGGALLGGAGGATSGTATGSALGSIVPGIGNVVGGVIGGLLGALGGGKSGYNSGSIQIPELSGLGKIENADGSQGIGALIASLSRRKKMSGGVANTGNIV